MKTELATIANYLTTRTESKKHGGYNVYEEEGKISIWYDTYYPNISVYVWIDGKMKLVASFNGGGFTQKYRSGNWEKHVKETLYPKALIAKEKANEARRERERLAKQEKFGPIDDSSIFA